MISKESFRTVSGEKIMDIHVYIDNFINESINKDDVEIWIGTDSQVYKRKTRYITAICLYRKGRGGHVVLFKEWIDTPRFHDRLWREVEQCRIACQLVDEHFKINKIENPIIPCLDLSPDPKFKSNVLYASAIGYLKGCGFDYTKGKPGALASIIADHYVKK